MKRIDKHNAHPIRDHTGAKPVDLIKQNQLMARTPEAEAAHQAFLKRCQDDLFLLPALKVLINGWLVSDGKNTDILSIGLVNVARPIIEKQERERVVEVYVRHQETQSPKDMRRIMLEQRD